MTSEQLLTSASSYVLGLASAGLGAWAWQTLRRWLYRRALRRINHKAGTILKKV